MLPALVVAGAGYSWWAAARPPFSLSGHLAVFAPALVVLVLAPRVGARSRRAEVAGSTLGLVVWAGLVAAVVGFELFNWLQHPREQHPTMSSLINEVDTLPVRRLMFFLWLGLGWHLARQVSRRGTAK